ncbi:uncharacterized protein DS421_11g329480 [Arachis hypogaea]|nr:uncharacterized protein DS421_11g329480 [Arachis hypogaea]
MTTNNQNFVGLNAGNGLRNRSIENKAVIVSEGEKNVWPGITERKVKPIVYKYFPLSEAVGHTAS